MVFCLVKSFYAMFPNTNILMKICMWLTILAKQNKSSYFYRVLLNILNNLVRQADFMLIRGGQVYDS